ncbi:MAG TPA: hypothetical protein DCM05_17430 [Elusimicrobia bacterium]|nr:hypothetical protein [Elusimicrobiota bacterium]
MTFLLSLALCPLIAFAQPEGQKAFPSVEAPAPPAAKRAARPKAKRVRPQPRPASKASGEVALSTVPVMVTYPPENLAVGDVRSMFIFGSVSHPRRPFRINGSTVSVHPKGGFLAYLPVEPGSFTFRCELELPRGTTVWTRTIRVASSAPPAPGVFAIQTESVQPAEDVELRPGDWLNVRMRASPGGVATFYLPGVAKALPMAETRSGTYEGAYQIRSSERFQDAEITVGLRGAGRAQVQALARGRLSVTPQPPGAVVVRSEGIVNVRSGPGSGYILFPPQGTRFLATGRSGSELRVELSARLSGWIPERAVDWAAPGTPPPSAVLGSISLAAADDASVLSLDLSQKVPFQVEEAADLSSLKLRLFSTTGHTNWIVYDQADDFVRQVNWSQPETGLTEVDILLGPGRILWGYDASWRGGQLRLELRKPPKLAPAPASVLKGRTIVLDPGHGPGAPGAVGPRGTWEEAVNFALARDLQALLAKDGAQVVLTRGAKEDDVSLPERTKRAFAKRGEVFVSLHNNALPDGDNPFERPHGYSVFYYHPHSFALAEAVYQAYKRHAPNPGEGLRYGNLYVARATQMPSVLTESIYMMYPEQEDLLLDPAKRKKFAQALVEGIKQFLEGERRRQTGSPKPKKT